MGSLNLKGRGEEMETPERKAGGAKQ